MGALRRLDNLVTINEDASDAPLNDDVLRQIAGSGGARQPEADEASVASRATSAHTVIPTPHGRARMGERAVSVKELQTAKKYGTITRARDDQRDGTARYKIEHNGIVYITDRAQKRVITTYHQIPEERDARVRALVRQVRQLLAKRSEEERRLEERLDALESELEEREREKWRDHIQVGDIIDAKDSEGRWFDSRIVEVDKDRGPGEVKVHYNGWSGRWDTWVDRKDESIQPHLTHTDDWRRLKVGDAIEMRGPGEKTLWFKRFVKEVDGTRVLVSSHTPNVDEQWLETSSEHICKLGTHIKSELEDARGPRVQAAGPRDAEEKRDAAPPPAPPRAKKNSGPVAHVPSPAEILSNFTADQAREAAAREAAERAAAAAEPPPAPVPPPPMLPHPWQAFWDARSERYYFGQPTTGQVQWDMPVAAPPPPPPPVRPAYTEASYERLVAELAEVRVRPSQHALDILRRQEVTVEDLCDLTHAMLVAAGLDQPDVHMIWSKIEVLRNRRIARGKSRGGC